MVSTARRALVAAFLVLVSALSAPAAALAAPVSPIGAESKYAAIVVDATTGEVLFAKRADSPRYPASITKVMTLYLVFEAMAAGKLSPDESIVVSRHAASQSPTKLGVPAGSSVRVDDAIRSLTTKSANDMSVALAERVAGTESRFAALMTLKAQELGMHNTRFVNSNGLPDSRQISTARDIAVLSRAMVRDWPQYYSYFSQKTFTYRGQTMNNHNRLLFQMEGVDGLKTGFTNASGYNLAATGVRDGNRLIGVVLGGSSGATRDRHMRELLETGFDIMRRRDNGEQILIAQNMFEREPQGPIAPAYGQGDADGPKIISLADQSFDGQTGGSLQMNGSGVITLRPIGYAQTTTLPTITEMTSTPVPNPPEKAVIRAPAKKAPAGRYVVQVGAFKTKSDARTQLSKVEKGFSKHFDDAEAIVAAKVNGFFRSQFTGLTETAAKSACKALKAKKVPCMVIAP